MDPCHVGYLCVADLPKVSGKIDCQTVQRNVTNIGGGLVFLACYSLQKMFQSIFAKTIPTSHLVREELILLAKTLFVQRNSQPLTLHKWFVHLQMMPLNKAECENIFIRMIKSCKYTKFHEINFKILAYILVTPSLLALMLPEWSGLQFLSFWRR